MNEKERFRPLNPDLTPRFGKLLSGARDSDQNDDAPEPEALFHALIKDAAGTITVPRNYGVEDFEIAAMLELVAVQRLVRKLCPDCKREEPLRSIDRTWMESVGRAAPEKAFYPVGCESCSGVGYQGRTGIFEIWNLGEKEKEFLLSHPDEQSVRKQLREWELPSLLDAAWAHLESGETSPSEIRSLGNVGD